MEKLIIINVYARRNIGSWGIGDEILKIAENVKEIWEKEDFQTASKYVEELLNSEDYDFEEDYMYEIDEENEIILIYNKMKDKYGSWGYEEVKIENIAPSLKYDEERCLSWIENDKEYVVKEIDKEEWIIEYICNDFDLEEDIYLTADEMKKVIEAFFSYLVEHFKNNYINGEPIISNNPYAYAYDGYSYDIENKYLTLYTVTTCPAGASNCKVTGYIVFEKKDKS